MPRPKLEVTHVWILEEVLPYEGASHIGVFFDADVAKGQQVVKERHGDGAGKIRWRQDAEGDWTTLPPGAGFPEATFFMVTKHEIRTR